MGIKMKEDLGTALRERDEWKASALRMQLNREFKSTIETLQENEKRFLKPGQHTSLPDFEQSMKQQIELMKTPISQFCNRTAAPKDIYQQPPPALRTFPRQQD